MKSAIVYTIILPFCLFFMFSANASLGFLKLFVAHKHENCAKASPTHHTNFCASFEKVAECHCTSSGLPKSMCQNMTTLYQRMISVFDTQQNACEYQKDTHTKNCMDSWNCYRLGGKDSKGRLCSNTGKACIIRQSME